MTMNGISKTLLACTLAAGLASGASAPAFAVDTGGTNAATNTAVPDYQTAKALVDARKYADAVSVLAALVKDEPKNADAWNLLGFSSRKMGNLKNAAKYYDYALRLDPKHLGALEYQGEMFAQLHRMDKANANLTMLASLCGTCEQYQDLKKAIETGVY